MQNIAIMNEYFDSDDLRSADRSYDVYSIKRSSHVSANPDSIDLDDIYTESQYKVSSYSKLMEKVMKAVCLSPQRDEQITIVIDEERAKHSRYFEALAAMSLLAALPNEISHHDNQSEKAGKEELIWDEDDVEYDDAPAIPPKRVFNVKLNIVEVKKGKPLPLDCYEEGW